MDEQLLRNQLGRTLGETNFEDLGTRRQGKVRDTYARDDQIILITTDRISAFDHVLRQTIPFKGQVLNQVAAYFFEETREVASNHVRAVPHPNVTVAVRCEPIPIEFVVRGYLAGHAWRVYRDGGRRLCGKPLPEGLRESSRLPRLLLTPATKAAEDHDEDITRGEALRRGLIDAATFDQLEASALALFKHGTALARKRGLLLVDTKYEFGRTPKGDVVLIDEVHTPDSSRYYYADTYEERLRDDRPQRQLSKEFVREWLMDHGFQGKPGQVLPDLPDDFRVEVARRYIELYERITGSPFVPEVDPDVRIEERIRKIVFDLQ